MRKCIYHMITLMYLILYSFAWFGSISKTGKELHLDFFVFVFVFIGITVIWGTCQIIKKIHITWDNGLTKMVTYITAIVLSYGALLYKGIKVHASIPFLVAICIVALLCLGAAQFVSDSFGGCFALILSSTILYFMFVPLQNLFSIFSLQSLASVEWNITDSTNSITYFEGIFERWQMMLHVSFVFDMVAVFALIAGFYAWKKTYPRMILGMAFWNAAAIFLILIGSQTILSLVSYVFTPIFAAIGLRSMLKDNEVVNEQDMVEEPIIQNQKSQSTEESEPSEDETDTQIVEESSMKDEEIHEQVQVENEISCTETAEELEEDDDNMHIEIVHFYPTSESEMSQSKEVLSSSRKNLSKNQQESEIMERTQYLEQSVKEMSQQIKTLTEQMEVLIELNRRQQVHLSNSIAQRRPTKGGLKGKNGLKKSEINVKRSAKKVK